MNKLCMKKTSDNGQMTVKLSKQKYQIILSSVYVDLAQFPRK